MKTEKLWGEFCQKKNIDINTPYEAWGFGSDEETANKLADLVVKGIKFGTASLYDDYVYEDELDKIPKPGDYGVILNGNDEAVCIIRNYDVYIQPFKEVPHFHAYAEGEGDRSLEYWRKVHKEFFDECAKESGIPFTEDSLVVCEKFSLEYIAGEEETTKEEKLLFCEASQEFAEEIAAYRQEMLDAESSFDGCFSLKRMPDIKEYVEHCTDWANPSREPDEHGAWGTVILCIRESDRRMVGCMQVHNILTERMTKYTGHVGYSVRPSERKKGYATRMLAKAKDFLASFGFIEINVSCLPGNEGSRRVIMANGGEYIETVFLESDGVNLERYKIDLR